MLLVRRRGGGIRRKKEAGWRQKSKQKHKAMWGINHVGHDLEIATQETDVFFSNYRTW